MKEYERVGWIFPSEWINVSTRLFGTREYFAIFCFLIILKYGVENTDVAFYHSKTLANLDYLLVKYYIIYNLIGSLYNLNKIIYHLSYALSQLDDVIVIQ